jgi:23S rRNA (cytosine1962-C5)-methyltransferase
MKAAVYLDPKKQNNIRRGHPWVFPKAILRTTGKPTTGELLEIYSATEEFIGVGVYNEHSLYRVRVLAQSFEQFQLNSLQSVVEGRLHQALRLRQSLDLPNSSTTAFRVFNSEGDGLSGLTIDRFNNILVVSSSAYWVEAHRELITSCIHKALPVEKILWFAQAKPLNQDGWKKEIELKEAGEARVLEGDIQYHVDFSNTQKTGLFLDQRENHQRIGALAKHKKVLDLYTYTGGFALHAAKSGAAAVTAVDSSVQAITLAKENALLNGLSDIQFIEGDAREYLTNAAKFDLVILDPPKLVPSQKHLERAKNYYRFLHREIFKHLQSGSLLLTCNCSSALNTVEFNDLINTQARMVGKLIKILGVYGPASCHPILPAFPEGNYLTATLVAVA